ncbi:hypothetical protein BT96DRAFT_1026946 [Gymnopus androsaceus JB14]|uniref:HTH CENPB-type domain-containing protein n=1 Tax=Gymnopus androsaceus JB14 TaxID=1447944 RepID=A0A6A4GFG1_9AGAR|nr:hypothetical protein BT96DRAFT_1026946 [Gymnopus androsaceus JB14]
MASAPSAAPWNVSSFHPNSNKRRPHAKGFKRQRLYDIDRQVICEYERSHPDETHDDIAIFFSIDRSTVTKILKDREKWLNVNTRGQGRVGPNRMLSKKRPLKFPEIESKMEDWLHGLMSRFYSDLPSASLPIPSTLPNDPLASMPVRGPLSDARLRAKAVEIARMDRISEEDFKASAQWVVSFKSRQCIRNGFWSRYSPNDSSRGEASLTSAPPISFLAHQTFSMQMSGSQPRSPPDHVTQNNSGNHQSPQPPLSLNESIPTHKECIEYFAKVSQCVDNGPGQGILSAKKREWLRKLEAQFIATSTGSPEVPTIIDSDEEES